MYVYTILIHIPMCKSWCLVFPTKLARRWLAEGQSQRLDLDLENAVARET